MKKKYIIPACEVYSMAVENNLMDISVVTENKQPQDYASDGSDPQKGNEDYIEFYSKRHHSFSAWDTWDD